MRVRCPDADRGESVDVNGTLVPVEDGVIDIPDDADGWLDRWCNANGYDRDAVVVDDTGDTCDVVKNDGDVCGRELPCPYHSED